MTNTFGLSDKAAAFLNHDWTPLAYPALDDHDGWRLFIAAYNARLLPRFAAVAKPYEFSTDTERARIEQAIVYGATPAGCEHPERALLFLHSGSLVLLGGALVFYTAVIQSAALRHRTYAVDFRTPPDHPFPAALDDCVAAYRAVLQRHDAKDVAIVGDSGGGNLAAALCLRLRQEDLPRPASLVLRWPQLDLTDSGDSIVTNRDFDPVLRGGLPEPTALYLDGHDPEDPLASPLFGDFSGGFPPTMLLSGTRDCFLSNAVRMHRALRKAAVETDLNVFEAMPHGGFGRNTPEDREVDEETVRFITRHWR